MCVSLTPHRSFQGMGLRLLNSSFCCLYKYLRRGCKPRNQPKSVVLSLQLPYVKFVFLTHLRGPAQGKGIVTGTITGMVAGNFLGPGGVGQGDT